MNIEKIIIFKALNEMVIFYKSGCMQKMSIQPDLIEFCKDKGIEVIEY